MNREDIDACISNLACTASEHVLSCPSNRRPPMPTHSEIGDPTGDWIVYDHDNGPYAIALYTNAGDAAQHAARQGYGRVGGRSKAEPRVNGTRPLTHPLDQTEEGLAMKATPKTCDAPTCDRPARSRNYAWCTLHDRRVRLYGTVDLPPGHERHQNQGHACAATGCEIPAKAKGYCGLHSERIRRHGSPYVAMPADRSHGEWFDCTDRVLACVDDMLGSSSRVAEAR